MASYVKIVVKRETKNLVWHQSRARGPCAGLGIPLRDGPPLAARWAERGGSPLLRAAGVPVRRLRFSPDGRLLGLLVQNETAVRIWDLSALHSRLAAMGLDWERDGTPRPAAVQDPPTGGGQPDTRGQSSAGEVVRR